MHVCGVSKYRVPHQCIVSIHSCLEGAKTEIMPLRRQASRHCAVRQGTSLLRRETPRPYAREAAYSLSLRRNASFSSVDRHKKSPSTVVEGPKLTSKVSPASRPPTPGEMRGVAGGRGLARCPVTLHGSCQPHDRRFKIQIIQSLRLFSDLPRYLLNPPKRHTSVSCWYMSQHETLLLLNKGPVFREAHDPTAASA